MFSLKAHTSSMENEEQKNADKMWLQIDLANDEIMAWSDEKVIGGFKWCFEAKLDDPKDNGKMMMVISIGCNQEEFLNHLWFAKCRFSISMNAYKFDTKYNRYFLNGHNVYKTEVEPGEKMRFMLDLEVLRSNFQNKMMALDTDLRFSIAISNNENEDKKEMVVKIITVNKLALASISGYFNNLFFGLWSERSSNTDFVDIKEEPNFDWKAFELMVYSAMSMGWMVHESEILEDETALEILKLSIKYDIPMMQNYCEEYMVKSVTFPKMQLLEVGEQLGIRKLMEHALATITLTCFGKEFGQNCEIRARLSDETIKLLDKRLEDEANGVKEEKKKETGKKRFHNHDELYDGNDDNLDWEH